MKTTPIQQKIGKYYKQISELAKEPRTNKNTYPAWGLNYHRNKINGYISETGHIRRNNAEIQIDTKGNLKLIKKPFLSTWRQTLKNISQMLEDITANYNNKEIVNKKVLNIFCFSPEEAEKLTKIASKIVSSKIKK